MSRINISQVGRNCRDNIRSRHTRRRKSKAARVRSHVKAWRKKAIYNKGAAERLDDVRREKEEVEQERDLLRDQLNNAGIELEHAKRRYRSLISKANKEKNEVVKLARERWMRRERDLKDKYEQRLSEMEVECERQEQGRLEAEEMVEELAEELEMGRIEAGARVSALEAEVMELHREIEDIYEDY